MKFRNNLPSVEEVKNTDIVDYLSILVLNLQKFRATIIGISHLSADEKTASFKVNRSMNRWYDFGDGKGGNLVDFGILFHKCSVADFLKKNKIFSFFSSAKILSSKAKRKMAKNKDRA
jgi:hypothetical protein